MSFTDNPVIFIGDACVQLLLTAMSYCTIPIILRFTLIKKKEFTKNKLIAIVVLNAIVIYLALHIPYFILTEYKGDAFSFSPMCVWSCVNFLILSSGNKKYHSDVIETSRPNNESHSSNDEKNASKQPVENKTTAECPAEKTVNITSANEVFTKQSSERLVSARQFSENPMRNTTDNFQLTGQPAPSFTINPDSTSTGQLNSIEIHNNSYEKETTFTDAPLNNTPRQSSKSNGLIITLSCICALFFLAFIAVGILDYHLSKENSNLSDEINSLEDEYANYYDYESLSLFYLDNAVMVFDGDTIYYHRYNCPQSSNYTRYLMFNISSAKGQGYSACPVCFQDDAETYFDSYISTY